MTEAPKELLSLLDFLNLQELQEDSKRCWSLYQNPSGTWELSLSSPGSNTTIRTFRIGSPLGDSISTQGDGASMEPEPKMVKLSDSEISNMSSETLNSSSLTLLRNRVEWLESRNKFLESELRVVMKEKQSLGTSLSLQAAKNTKLRKTALHLRRTLNDLEYARTLRTKRIEEALKESAWVTTSD